MARFVFKLEGVLRHRHNVEKDRQRQVALIQQQLQLLDNELRRLDRSVQQATEELRSGGLVGRLDMSFIAAHRRFVAATQRKAMVLVQKMALVQKQLEEARRSLAEAAIQRKIIEKLREKHLARWRDDQTRHELSQLDEIGMQLGYRHLREAGEMAQGGEA